MPEVIDLTTETEPFQSPHTLPHTQVEFKSHGKGPFDAIYLESSEPSAEVPGASSQSTLLYPSLPDPESASTDTLTDNNIVGALDETIIETGVREMGQVRRSCRPRRRPDYFTPE
ncbi:uncharacterized protein ATNIH1004_003777 [Aspergillus tanneri]|uniref:Uncharacterized protein n=1 Tax=Aspergillus tanneri TaxID=1220188 RepID=A0A5M9N0H1_9EURO|nr:uncharacterized protein ATNIH1004_003777 [Aspergillus tanneri]KAA8651084.1 hypothetical protein ATNIH1004_003777 [Aspergillus tanneri]